MYSNTAPLDEPIQQVVRGEIDARALSESERPPFHTDIKYFTH